MRQDKESKIRTLIIINPSAAGGKAVEIFKKVEDQIARVLGEFTSIISEKPEDLAGHVEFAAAAGIERLLAVGGDGTNHAIVNALLARPRVSMSIAFGNLPVGTGSDWARALCIPSEPLAAAEWLARARPVACDLGKIEYVDTLHGGHATQSIFLNIASAGVSGEVDARVNRSRKRTASSFLKATIGSLLVYKPQRVTINCDGVRFYEGSSYLLAVANGRYFGRGMWVAPKALIDDGLFDVVLVEGMPRLRVLLALRTVFSGKHLLRKDVHATRAAKVQVHSEEGPLGIDLDGEEAQGQDLRFTILPGALKILLHPSTTQVLETVPSANNRIPESS